jgi:hypothetical protein
MTDLLAYARNHLAAASSLMLGRADGMSRLDVSLEGFWRSFAAVVLVVPFALLALLSQRRLLGPEAGPPAIGSEMLALLVDWVAFPIVFAAIARPLGLGRRYVPYIVARNWAAVVITALVSVIHALHVVGILPSQFLGVVLIAAIGISLRFSYMVARIVLDAPMGVALPLVLLDFLMSLVIWTLYDRLA